jgi:trimeric autotransporter adhesin
MGATSVLKRTIVLACTLLLAAAGGIAQILVDGNSGSAAFTATLTSAATYQNVYVTSSSSSSVAFTVTVTETDLPNVQWVSASPTSGFTPAIVTITRTNDLASQGAGPFHATVTFTPSGGGSSTSVAVLYQPGQGTGTGTPVTPSSITVGVPSGGTATNMLTLTNDTGSPITITQIYAANGSAWLSGSANPLAVLAGGTSTISVVTTAGSLPNNTYADSLVTDIAGQQSAVVPVTFTVGAGGLTLSTIELALSYTNGTSSSQQVTVSGTIAYNAAATTTSGGNWLLLNVGTQSGTSLTNIPGADLLTVLPAQAVVSTLPTGNYTGSITVTDANNPNNTATIAVTLSVNIAAATSITATPTSLPFYYETGGIQPPFQTLVIIAPTGSFSATATSDQNWLFLSTHAGSVPGNIQVSAASLTGLTPGNYMGNVALTVGSLTQNIPVTLTVNATGSPVAFAGFTSLTGSIGTVLFTAAGSAVTPSSQPITIYSSDGSALTTITVNSSPSWLTVTQSGDQLTLTPNTTGLVSQTYSGAVVVTASNSTNNGASTITNSPISIPVILVNNGGNTGALTITVLQNLSFQSTPSGVSPSGLTLTVSAAAATDFIPTSTCASQTPCPWVTITALGYITPQTLTVNVNPSGLANGSYSGTIDLTASGVTQTVPITLTVTGGAAQTGTVSASPSSLTFTASTGGQAQSQTVTVSSTGGEVPYTVSVSANTSWLTVSPTSADTQSNVTITATPTGLAAGSYQGTVTITAGNTVTIPVTLTVQAPPVVSASTTSLSFVYLSGGQTPPAQSVSLSGSTGGFTATAASDTGNWLSVSPTSGSFQPSTPDQVSVSVNPSGISSGQHTGTITVTGTGGLTGQVVITVSLTINPALPSVTQVVNGASFLAGAISPGEVITLFGTNIGPTTPATAQITNGTLTTQLGGAQVLVNGFAAPMIYASATQVSAVVPYEIASYSLAGVGVSYLGQTSNINTLPVVATAPGIFTQNSSGSGAAGFNGNFSVNGPNNAAAAGSTVVFFLTGEGQTIPPGVTGTINSSAAQNPSPAAPISILIGGLPATYSYAGGIDGVVEGIMQLNVQIPAGVSPGTVPVAVTIGGNSTQSGVTVSVQ